MAALLMNIHSIRLDFLFSEKRNCAVRYYVLPCKFPYLRTGMYGAWSHWSIPHANGCCHPFVINVLYSVGNNPFFKQLHLKGICFVFIVWVSVAYPSMSSLSDVTRSWIYRKLLSGGLPTIQKHTNHLNLKPTCNNRSKVHVGLFWTLFQTITLPLVY